MRPEYLLVRNRPNASLCSRTTSESATWDSHAGKRGVVDAQEDAFPADLARGHPGRLVPRQRGALDQVRVLRVGGVQPGEPGQRADLAEPFGLHDVRDKPGQRPRHPASAKREVVGRLGRRRGGEDVPLGREQVGVLLLLVAVCGLGRLGMLLDGIEDLVLAPLVQDLELGQRPERIEDPAVAHVLQLFPQLGDLGLQLARPGGRHGERGQGLREPGVRCPDDDRDRLGVAFLESPEVRVTAAAHRQRFLAPAAHGLADVPLGRAPGAPDHDVGAPVAAVVVHQQRRVAGLGAGAAPVHELAVGEVVQVPVDAGEHEPRGDRQRLPFASAGSPGGRTSPPPAAGACRSRTPTWTRSPAAPAGCRRCTAAIAGTA